MSRYCELLNWNDHSLSQARRRYHSLHISTGFYVSISCPLHAHGTLLLEILSALATHHLAHLASFLHSVVGPYRLSKSSFFAYWLSHFTLTNLDSLPFKSLTISFCIYGSTESLLLPAFTPNTLTPCLQCSLGDLHIPFQCLTYDSPLVALWLLFSTRPIHYIWKQIYRTETSRASMN